ncbi:MAG: hypothetical protein AAGC60_18060 [Acidobacteriota bacterium]
MSLSRPGDDRTPSGGLDALCAVLCNTLHGVELVGILASDGSSGERMTPRALHGPAAESRGVAITQAVTTLLQRLASDLEAGDLERNADRDRAGRPPARLLVHLGATCLLLRATGGPAPAVLFLTGPAAALRRDAWRLVDATAVLAEALLGPPPGTTSQGSD